MADLWHIMGNDFAVAADGDLLLASDPDETNQRVYRRLMTNPGAYLWAPGYGAGLPGFVGQIINANAIKAIVLNQMKQESGVMQVPAPVVTVVSDATGFCGVTVQYVDSNTGQSVQIAAPPS